VTPDCVWAIEGYGPDCTARESELSLEWGGPVLEIRGYSVDL